MALPTGTVTFWMTDIEGSTRLLRRLGDGYPEVLAAHHSIVRSSLAAHEGVEVSTEGDSFFCVFRSARAAVEAAVDVQLALAAHSWPADAEVRVRMGLHTGEGRVESTGYVGLDVHRAARVAAAAHGGQVLLTAPSRTVLEGAWPAQVGYVFLGSHRLKDLEGPELLYQLVIQGLPARFPPVRSLEAPGYDLPATHSAFIGREADVAALIELLDAHRLVTVTGPGGVGKTRLAVTTAARAGDRYPGGVVFVPLAAVQDADLVPDEIARALALPPGEYGGEHGLRRLADQLAGRRMLLILDNVEQLLPGASRIGSLARALPEATVLATSRAPLRLLAEREYPLAPLEVPDESAQVDPDTVLASPAVQQFLDRARSARPGFVVGPADLAEVACVVRAVDGLPLAVELVAARLRSLTLHQIAQRLGNQLSLLRGGPRDLPARQQALRETLQWSYDLLEQPARAVLPALAVFPGGATIEALEDVVFDLVPHEDVLDAVEALVEHGFLLRSVDSTDRYRTLQVVREFAAELLVLRGADASVRRRQAEWVARYVDATAPDLLTNRQAAALTSLREEHDNVRSALAWATEHDVALAARIATAVWRFWQMRGHLAEGSAALDKLLEKPHGSDATRVRLLSARGGIAYWQFDIPAMRSAYREAADLAERLEDDALLASTLYDLAFPELQSRHFDEVIALAERSERLFEQLTDPQGVARARWMRGLAILHMGDPAAAEPLFREGAEHFQAVNDTYYRGWALRMLGRALLEQGNTEEARQTLRESLRVFAPAGDTSALILHLADFAALAGVEGDAERQVRLVGAIRQLRRTTGTRLVDYEVNAIRHLDESLASLGPRANVLLTEGAAMDMDAVVAYVLAD